VDDEYQFENGSVCFRKDAKQLNQKLAYILSEYQEALDSVNLLKYTDCIGLREALEKIVHKPTHMTLSELFDWRVSQFRDEHRDGSAKMYESNKKIFVSILGDCPIEYLTPYDVRRVLAKAFIKRNYSDAYTRILMAQLKASLNAAIEDGLVKYDEHPFRGYTMTQGEPRLMDISVEQFRRVREYTPRTRRETVSKDMLLLSFYLGGINLMDLTKADLSGDELTYIRQKTSLRKKGNKTTVLTIQPEARIIIDKYINERGNLSLFPTSSNYESVRSYINKGLREMNQVLGIKTPFCFYTGRKTFAQFASLLRIPTEIIEYCIGQSMKSGRAIYYYIRTTQKQADDAVRQVIDYTINPSAFKV
jgi:integrase